MTSESRDLAPGEAIVSWITPRDQGPAGTLGFMATLAGRPIPRELIPLAGLPGRACRDALRDLGLEQASSAVVAVKAVDGAGNLGPAATRNCPVPGQARRIAAGIGPEIAHVPAATPLPRLGAVRSP